MPARHSAEDAMLELWLVRHAESEGNRRGDASDSPLTAAGRQQATALAKLLGRERFDRSCSSDLLRCQETAALAGVPVALDARLRELVAGPEAQFVDLAQLTASQLAALVAPREPIESGLHFRARVLAWLAEQPADGRVLAFTHTQVIRELHRHLRPGEPVPAVANASITRITRS